MLTENAIATDASVVGIGESASNENIAKETNDYSEHDKDDIPNGNDGLNETIEMSIDENQHSLTVSLEKKNLGKNKTKLNEFLS